MNRRRQPHGRGAALAAGVAMVSLTAAASPGITATALICFIFSWNEDKLVQGLSLGAVK